MELDRSDFEAPSTIGNALTGLQRWRDPPRATEAV